jgi:hypothetical protein
MLFRNLGHAIASGLTATMTSTGALAAAALAEGKGPAQPLNATSHIVYGNDAAHYRDADIDHTIIGLGTHAAATVFCQCGKRAHHALVLSASCDAWLEDTGIL